MTKSKKFDCIQMKDAIQARHTQEYKEMTPAERWKIVERNLAVSNDKVARKWRSIKPTTVPATVSLEIAQR